MKGAGKASWSVSQPKQPSPAYAVLMVLMQSHGCSVGDGTPLHRCWQLSKQCSFLLFCAMKLIIMAARIPMHLSFHQLISDYRDVQVFSALSFQLIVCAE